MSVFFKSLRRVIVVLHLCIVVITVSHLHDKIHNRFFTPLNNLYSAYTNTNRCFGFFAPEVYSDLSLNITTVDQNRRKAIYRLYDPNFETHVRLYSFMGHFGENYDTVQMSLFSRCIALKIFNDNPAVAAVDIHVDWNVIPTMRANNGGKKIAHSLFYATHLEPF